jgi:putative nucleotidyltransferase with HDIG domain
MAFFNPLLREKARRILLILYALSSVLPILLVIFICFNYVLPELNPGQVRRFRDLFIYGIGLVTVIPLLSFFLISQMSNTLEKTARSLETRTAQLVHDEPKAQDSGDENEVSIVVRSFNSVFDKAIQNRNEFKNLKEVLSNFIGVGADLTTELDFDRLFPMIISKVTKVMSAERTSLYVIDWKNHELWTKVSEGVEQIRLPIGEGISGRVAETGELLNIKDAWELPYFNRDFDRKNHFRTKSVLCMPIKNRGGESIGVIQVINKIDKEGFDSDDEILFQALTSQVGIAFENSILIEELQLSFESAIDTLSTVVDERHPLTAGHSKRVTKYSLMIAEEMGLRKDEIEVLKFAALLHDIGKIGISDEILLKNGPYNSEEREEMQTHTTKTRNILEKFHFPETLKNVPRIACYHHEKMNGRGYPDGLQGNQLDIGSKIMAVADVFDALTSKRDYPKYSAEGVLGYEPMPIEKAISILKEESGTSFDPDIVDAFLHCIPRALDMFKGDHFPPEYVESATRFLIPGQLSENTTEMTNEKTVEYK